MTFDNEHREIFIKIANRLDIDTKIVSDVIEDYINKVKERLKEIVSLPDKKVPNDFRLMIPNLGSFYNVKGRRLLKKLKKIENEESRI